MKKRLDDWNATVKKLASKGDICKVKGIDFKRLKDMQREHIDSLFKMGMKAVTIINSENGKKHDLFYYSG